MLKKKIEKILKDNHLSITTNRIKIISCLEDGLSFHTVKNIADHTKLNIKSIYNNIKALEKSGIVDSFSFNGISKFAICNKFYNQENPVIHIVNDKKISHLNINKNILKTISNELTNKGYKPLTIRIFAEVEKEN